MKYGTAMKYKLIVDKCLKWDLKTGGSSRDKYLIYVVYNLQTLYNKLIGTLMITVQFNPITGKWENTLFINGRSTGNLWNYFSIITYLFCFHLKSMLGIFRLIQHYSTEKKSIFYILEWTIFVQYWIVLLKSLSKNILCRLKSCDVLWSKCLVWWNVRCLCDIIVNYIMF